MKYCDKCNKTVSDKFKHCPECGNKLSHIVKDIDTKESSSKTIGFDLFAKKTIFAIIVVAAAIIFLGFVIANPSSLGSLLNPTQTTTSQMIAPTTTTISNFDISVKAVNEYTKESIVGAEMYLDGSDIGLTNEQGEKAIPNLHTGTHKIEARYKGIISDLTVNIPSSNSFTITMKAPITVSFSLKDKLTSEAVDNVEIFLDGKSFGTTSQDGGKELNDIIPDSYDLSIAVPGYGKIDVGTLDVGTAQVAATVDMPRPDLAVTVTKTEKIWPYCDALTTCLGCKVTVTNIGKAIASNPVGVCAMYEIANNAVKPIGYTQVKFDPLAPGASASKESEDVVKYNYFSATDKQIAVVVFDNDKYVPSTQTKLNLQLSGNIVGKVMEGIASFCASNPTICIKAVGVVAQGLGG